MDQPAAPVRRLSSGPAHHFFGYYGICPWNKAGTHHLALETDFHTRAPAADDVAAVGLVDMTTGTFEPLAQTRAFNLQQGSMLHWLEVGFGEEITFNDWEGEHLVSRVLNPVTGAHRTIDGAIAAVSPTAPIAVGLNFARMAACRKVVGYANNRYNPDHLDPLPEDDGLWRLDLQTGAATLIVPIAEVGRRLPLPEHEGQARWFNHVVFNPDGSRLMFFCRTRQPPGQRFLDSLWTVNVDGSDLQCRLDTRYRVSHFAWFDPRILMISTDVLGEMGFVTLHDASEPAARPFATDRLPADGHNAVSPNGRWVACDTYPRGEARLCHLLIYNRQTGQLVRLGAFQHPAHIYGDWRCDLHPRWSRDGRSLSFDSVHEGSRQIYTVDVSAWTDAAKEV